MTKQSNPILDRAAANGVSLEMQGAVAVVRLCRPAKRNALSDSLIEALRDVFQNLPAEAGAAVIHGEGDHFCAGLDLSELKERDAGEGEVELGADGTLLVLRSQGLELRLQRGDSGLGSLGASVRGPEALAQFGNELHGLIPLPPCLVLVTNGPLEPLLQLLFN